MPYVIGQRWISQSEPKLGLGIVTEIANKRVNISFPAASENRLYAIDSAPLSRVRYHVGDSIRNHADEALIITAIVSENPLIEYQVRNESDTETTLSEIDLNCFIQFTSPLQRLTSGHTDRNSAFRLRCETLEHLNRLQQSGISGLMGARADLLSHQVYVADTVCRRQAPRVLLADEVGLGKTIEAGLILQAQLYNQLIQRVLIIVPESLTHQWLVEMLRRFNLRFSLFDQSRFDAILQEGIENPFETEQLILCSLDFLIAQEADTDTTDDTSEAARPTAEQCVLTTHWDMIVIDEAHHLYWSETKSSPQYDLMERLSEKTASVLLLTATPEQAGIESHFARLRLLDPERFHCLSQFREQQSGYAPIIDLITELKAYLAHPELTTSPIAATDSNEPNQTGTETDTDTPEVTAADKLANTDLPERLERLLGQSLMDNTLNLPLTQAVTQFIHQLLDLHGTGRILFRNTRHSVQGFPERVPHSYPLSVRSQFLPEPDQLHQSESALQQDPRTAWLVDRIQQLAPEKVLVICKSSALAKALDSYLKHKQGIKSCCFRESLTLVERDRAAAYFADRENGATVLVCSEIGSEGRNFQFCCHLVLWDLPENPDLLEQRIGRLDRIGQKRDINIHIPYLTGQEQEGWFRFYHHGLNAFTKSCAFGYAIALHFEQELSTYLQTCEFESEAAQHFIASVHDKAQTLAAEMAQGRDPLLELNSCNPEKAQTLIEQLEFEEHCQLLSSYLDRLYTLQGIDTDYQSDQTLIIKQPSPAPEPQLFDIPEEGLSLTYHRLKALSREDVDFITWEHPLVVAAMEQMTCTEYGNCALATISVPGVRPGTLFLEAIFCLNTMAPVKLGLQRFLPISPKRIVVDINGKNLSAVLPVDKLNALCRGVKRSIRHAVITEVRTQVPELLHKAQAIAETDIAQLLVVAKETIEQQLGAEIERLTYLRQRNPLVRESEITLAKQQLEQSLLYVDRTGLELQALRLIINT